MTLPAILSLDFTRPEYKKGSISLSRLNKFTSTNGIAAGSAIEKVVIRLNSMAIALRALNADSIADELDDIASEIKKLPVRGTLDGISRSSLDALSSLPPVSPRRA